VNLLKSVHQLTLISDSNFDQSVLAIMQLQHLRAREAIFMTTEAFELMYKEGAAKGVDSRRQVPPSPSTASHCKKVLSGSASAIQEVDADYGLGAECRFCLMLWGVMEGLDWDPADANNIQESMLAELMRMAKFFPEVQLKFLLKPLESCFEKRFGPVPWAREQQLASESLG
jgi:hypothetical protein